MSRKAPDPKTIESFEKFKKLASLAMSEDDGESTEEARNAAVKAIEMLDDPEGDLVVLPRAEVEALKRRIEGASAAMAKADGAKKEGMMLGALLGFGVAKSGFLK